MTPLAHRRILITRTRHQASDLATQLEALGATPILIPTIEIAPPTSFCALDTALACLHTYDWLIFTSANAVDAFHQRITSLEIRVPHLPDSTTVDKVGNRASDPHSAPEPQKFPKIAAIGPSTAKAVQGIGLTVDLLPPQYVAESLAEAIKPHALNSNFLLIRAAEARDILPTALTAAGATVTIADAYRNQIPPDSIPALQSLFATAVNYPDAITFTSSSTATNLLALLEAAGLSLPPEIQRISIGPITSQTLRDLDLPPHAEAAQPTIPALVEKVVKTLKQGDFA